jgi:membrane-bound lytic murein transglycosylase B
MATRTMSRRRSSVSWGFALAAGLLTWPAPGADAPAVAQSSGGSSQMLSAEVGAFIADMAERHGFDRGSLLQLFRTVQVRQDILDAISKPAEKKPWYQYRPIFLDAARIEGGTEFWNAHAEVLREAQARYGVPAEVIVAIIGVETRYGQNTGRYPVLDALATLAFHYPPRSQFFRSELEQFLLLAQEEHLDPSVPKGSYAGAMGIAQLMPSSFRAYAVDFDGDGRRDLWGDPADAIGSVANYLAQKGWVRGGPIAVPLSVAGEAEALPVSASDFRPKVTLKSLRALGVRAGTGAPEETPATIVALEAETGREYWAGFQNFYVITQYNRSPLYAMAVTQLSAAIRSAHGPARGL